MAIEKIKKNVKVIRHYKVIQMTQTPNNDGAERTTPNNIKFKRPPFTKYEEHSSDGTHGTATFDMNDKDYVACKHWLETELVTKTKVGIDDDGKPVYKTTGRVEYLGKSTEKVEPVGGEPDGTRP